MTSLLFKVIILALVVYLIVSIFIKAFTKLVKRLSINLTDLMNSFKKETVEEKRAFLATQIGLIDHPAALRTLISHLNNETSPIVISKIINILNLKVNTKKITEDERKEIVGLHKIITEKFEIDELEEPEKYNLIDIEKKIKEINAFH